MNHDDLNLDEPSAPSLPKTPAPARRPAERLHDGSMSGAREVHLLDYVRVIYKRRWLAGTVFLLVLGTTAVSILTATPIYEAKNRLLIESDERNVVQFQQVVDENASRPDYYQTQFNILQSRALARKTLDDLTGECAGPHPAFSLASTCRYAAGHLDPAAPVAVEIERNPFAEVRRRRVLQMQVDVRLAAVAGVTDKAEHLVRHLDVQGLDPAQVTLIGDSLDDAASAQQVGARCVLYSGGFHDAASLAVAGVPVVDSLALAVELAEAA